MTTDAIGWSDVELAIQQWIVGASGYPGNHVVWNAQNTGRPTSPFISMSVIADVMVGMDSAEYLANPLVATLTVSAVTPASDTLTVTSHGRTTGDGPFQAASTGTLPGGVAAATDYWLVVVDSNTVKLSPTFLGSINVSPTIVDITNAGSGSITLNSTADTEPHGKEIVETARGQRLVTVSIQSFGAEGVATGPSSPYAVLTTVVAAARLPSVRFTLNESGIGVRGFSGIRRLDTVIETSVLEPRAQVDVDLYLASELTAYETRIATAVITPTYDGQEQAPFQAPD